MHDQLYLSIDVPRKVGYESSHFEKASGSSSAEKR